MLSRRVLRLIVCVAVGALSACAITLFGPLRAGKTEPAFEVLLVGANASYVEFSRTLDAILSVRSIATLQPRVALYTALETTARALHKLGVVHFETADLGAVLLSYVAQRYTTLPDFVLFAPAAPASFETFTRALKVFDSRAQLVPLAEQAGCLCDNCETAFDRSSASCVERFKSFRRGQFIISKAAITRQPVLFYERMLENYKAIQDFPSQDRASALERLEAVWSRKFACPASAECTPEVDNNPASAGVAHTSRNIWLLWLSGWDDAPWLALRVVHSWRLHNPTWNIVLLTAANLENYVTEPPYLSNEFISPQARSDIIRLHVLAAHGGVWADATVLCTQPLDGWMHALLEPTGFWMYHGTGWPPPKPPSHANTAFPASWFMAAARGSYMAQAWRRAADEFWASRLSGADDYFWMDALFRSLLRVDPIFAREWSLVPYISCEDLGQSHMFTGAVHKAFRSRDGAWLETNPPYVLKLSHHKLPRNEADFSWLWRRTAGFVTAGMVAAG
jgi:hypothetical protein